MLALRARLVYSALTVFALVGLLIYSGCTVSQNPVSGRQRAYAYSWEQEQELGREADLQMQEFYGVYDEEGVVQYTEEVGERVLAESHLRAQAPDEQFEIPFEWRVLDSPIVNAFALPGGYVYVSRGLLAHMNNEAQLAVVLGHEVGHVAARHSSARAVQQQLAQLGLIAGAIAAQEFIGDTAGETVLGLGSVAAQLIFLSYSRENERESDDLGVEYAARAGYVAAEGSEFFRSLERISEEAEAGLPQWASTHPDPGEREQDIIELAEQFAEEYDMTELNEEAFLASIDGIVLGEDPRRGLIEDGMFYHPNKAFQYALPGDFEAQLQEGQVVMVSSAEDAAMLQTFALGTESAQQAAADFSGQDGVNIVEEGATQVSGRTAHGVVADAQTQDGQVVRLLAYFIEHGEDVVIMMGETLRENFDTYQNRFIESIESFEELTDRSILNVEPDRLEVTEADRQAAFQDFLPDDLPQGLSPEDLAIINQVELDETIEAGRPLKLPR